MDEPFGAVDPLTRERLQAQFGDIQKTVKKTIIFVTHDLDEAIRLGDRIAIMESGRLVQYDSPEVTLARPANKFVRDFVGTDRALKRLSRLSVENIVKPAFSVKLDTAVREVARAMGNRISAWVVDNMGHLVGWVNRDLVLLGEPISQIMSRTKAEDVSITRKATMREALSRMLGLGFRTMPVIDEEKCLIGEVTLRDIEAATSEVKT
jgi:osmoprotectant transport system ATP-binding protein